MGTGGVPTGALKAPKGGAKGATPPEGGGNPAKGGCSTSMSITRLDVERNIIELTNIFWFPSAGFMNKT